jgi:protein-S-isoprenylcysteine O-methyltransferase Ste14
MSNCRVRQPADTPEDTKLACRSSFEALDGPVLERSHSLPMSSLRRAINLILALMLVALGGGGIVYFYFIDPIWPRWIIIAAIIVGAAGLYWLWDEHVNVLARPKI